MLQLFIWLLIAFYIALGVVLIVKGAVIAQAMYDLAQKLSQMRYGWLIIIGIMSASSFVICIQRHAPSPVPWLI